MNSEIMKLASELYRNNPHSRKSIFDTPKARKERKRIWGLSLSWAWEQYRNKLGMNANDLAIYDGMSITSVNIYSFKQLCLSRSITKFYVPSLEGRTDGRTLIQTPMDLVRWARKFVKMFGTGVVSLPIHTDHLRRDTLTVKIECCPAFFFWHEKEMESISKSMERFYANSNRD